MFFPFVMQENDNDCALACLSMVYQFYYKQQLVLNELKEECFLFENQSVNLLKLKELALKYQLIFEVYKIKFQQLKKLKINNPIILQVVNTDLNYHFILIYKKKKDYLLVADPQNNSISWYKINDFFNTFTGVIIDCKMKENPKHFKKKVTKKINLFLVPEYFLYAFNVLVSNIILIIIFFFSQVFYKNFINQIIINNNFQIALLLLITFFIINIVHLIINFILNNLFKKFHKYFTTCLIQLFYKKWFSLKPITIRNYNNSYYLQIYQDINNIANVFTNNILELIISFIGMIIISAFIIKINLIIWALTVITGIINFVFSFIFMKIQKPLIKKNIDKKMQLQNEVINTNQNFEDSYFRNLLFHLNNNIKNKTLESIKIDYLLSKTKITSSISNGFIKYFLNFVTMYIFLFLIFNNKFSFSELIFISSINIYVLNFFYNLGDFCYFYNEFKKSYNRFNDFLNLKEKNNKRTFTINKFNNQIEFLNCNFKIDNKCIFKNLNLKLNGHNLLLGDNGVGKTSLLSLLSLKYQNYQGLISIDNINIINFSDHIWQEECIYLSFNSKIFAGTVLENLFSFKTTKEKIQILEKLNVESFLFKFNLNLNSYCSNYGTNLSQGQKQILLFLSLFFYEWKIILLDEVLSNVVYEIKVYLLKLLMSYFPYNIIIYASHDILLKNFFNNIIDLNIIKGE